MIVRDIKDISPLLGMSEKEFRHGVVEFYCKICFL